MVGFRANKKDSKDSAYTCPHCSFLLRDPVQLTDCGHRMCLSCVNEQEGDVIICSECHEKTLRKNLIADLGVKNDMQTLLIICALCNWAGVLKNYQDHLNQIHPNPICTYCSQQFNSVNDLNQHEFNKCEKITIYCSLKQFGCEDLIPRINLSQHYLSIQHQKALVNFVRRHSKIDLDQTTNITADQVKDIYETIDILAGGMETLNNDVQRLHTESIRYQTTLDPLAQDLSTLKIASQEQNDFLNGIKTNQEILQQDVASMGQKINDMKTTSYDGTLIWKISNVQEKLANAQSERQTSIYSVPFYSSPTGYKMCVRLYLYGDGNARRTHMSLFFVLMRGEYDAILKFPFNFKVTFCLYEQTSEQRHIIDSFRPDIKSSSFQRPRSDMNIASGIPKFIPLAVIQQENSSYVRDDTMFIKVMVDFRDIPKTVLPYAFSLSPALTTQMQQTMIQQECERRQQQQTSSSSMTNTETDQSVTGSLQQTNTVLNIPTNMNGKPTGPINDNINHTIEC